MEIYIEVNEYDVKRVINTLLCQVNDVKIKTGCTEKPFIRKIHVCTDYEDQIESALKHIRECNYFYYKDEVV